jgi:hypothetical protein
LGCNLAIVEPNRHRVIHRLVELLSQVNCAGYPLQRNGGLPPIELEANAEKLDILRGRQFRLE